MAELYKSMGRSWIKLWVPEWLDGTSRYEMSGGQRAFWVDLLTLAGRSRIPGVVCAGEDPNNLFGYPLDRYAGILGDGSVDILETFKLFESQGKIEIVVTREESPTLYAIRILSWAKYQSEYMRQRAYRAKVRPKTRQGANKVTPKNTPRLPVEVEGDVEVDGEIEGEREHLARSLFEQFWITYPKKLDKGLAFNEWLRLSPIDWDRAAESVVLWAKSEEWEEPKFIPSPVNFIKKRRWESKPVTKPQDDLMAKAKELEARFEKRGH